LKHFIKNNVFLYEEDFKYSKSYTEFNKEHKTYYDIEAEKCLTELIEKGEIIKNDDKTLTLA
jgi:hypothetical protein